MTNTLKTHIIHLKIIFIAFENYSVNPVPHHFHDDRYRHYRKWHYQLVHTVIFPSEANRHGHHQQPHRHYHRTHHCMHHLITH